MTLFYYLLLCVAHIVALPVLFIMSFRQKHKDSVPLRFFFPKNRSKEYYDIWLHACSVGEVQSLQTIIESMPKSQSILLTVVTQTGYAHAKSLYAKHNIAIGYLPFETLLPLCYPTCKKLFVFEAELWLMLFVCAKQRGAETKLINARISARSVSRYQKLRIFYRHLFCFVDSVLSQSDADTTRLTLLGAKNVQTLGNIKLLNPIVPKITYKKPKSLIVVAASTHANEESLILWSWKNAKDLWQKSNHAKNLDINDSNMQDATTSERLDATLHDFAADNMRSNCHSDDIDETKQYICNQDSVYNGKLCKDFAKSLLIVVPRHPERFSAVYDLCNQYGKTLRLSALPNNDSLNMDALDAEILLVDSMGMLVNFYAISDIVILGGAFAKAGGHNPLEPANFHNVVISGVEIFNQRALFSYVRNYYLVSSKDSLSTLLYRCGELETAFIDKGLRKDMIDRILL